MARCLEALAGVDLEKAEKGENVPIEEAQLAYEKFLEDYDKEDSQSIFVPLARERSQALKNESTQEYYAWLQTQYPTPEDRATPDDTGTDPALPPGHPPVSPSTPPITPGTPPIGPTFPEGPDFPTADESQDAMMNELERIVNEAKPNAAGGGSDGGSGPAGAEKPTGNEAEASNLPASSNEDNGSPEQPKPGGSDPASADEND